MVSKDDGVLSDFVRQFADSLATEYRFIEDISHGLADSRPDAVQRHLSLLFSAVNVAANSAPFGSALISFITGQVEKHLQKDQNSKTETNLSALSKHPPDRRNFLFEQISIEVMYRYGACIYQFIEFVGPDQLNVAVDRLARTGAIRIVYYALKRNIGFEHCDKLVRGLVDGFDGFPERDLLSKLVHGAMNLVDTHKRPVELSCEGMYTRSGFMTPGSEFWIHSDFDRQKGRDGRIGGYVTFAHPAATSGTRREDHVVPKYGYISTPNKNDPLSIGYRKHHPVAAENVHVNISKRFRYRYVLPGHIVSYLTAMKSVSGEDDKVNFNAWLTQGPHAKEFHLVPGFHVKALFRDTIDARLLEQHGVSFSDGIFSDVDFSYSLFRNVTLRNLQRARLIGCTFIGCTATGSSLSGADLSLSTIDHCKFEGLSGILTLNFGNLAASSFAGCTFTVSSFNGMQYDDSTLQSFSTSYAKASGGAAGGPDERLYEMLLEYKLKQEEMAALMKEKEEAMRQQELDRQNNRDLLNSLREAGAEKEIQHSQRVTSVEEKILLLSRRLDAYDQTTLGKSIELIRPLPSTDENPITKIFEAVFFQKPMKLLKLLQKNPNVVKWATLPRAFNYSTSGVDGEVGSDGDNGCPGASGGGSGTDAVSGVNGQHGTAAAPNTVSLMSIPGQRIFVVSPKASEVDSTILPLYDGSVKVNLFATGGRGGKGGKGGKGGAGQNGLNGRDATSGGSGTSGTAGGNGGRGGNGGMGGNAGNSADITVLVKEADMDLLSLLGKIENRAPQGGEKGEFGLGGAGGIGGKGGRSYSGYDSSSQKHYTNPGGSNGPNGVAGMNGRDGQTGLDGQAGNLIFHVVNVITGDIEEYSSIYKIQLTRVSLFHSISGIIEPGQVVRMMSFEVTNSGGMPTPAVDLMIGMTGNSYLLMEDKLDTWAVRKQIQPRGMTELTDPLPFKIARGLKAPFLTETLNIATELKMWAKFPRTNVEFAGFQRDKIPVSITNPLEISLVAGARATVFDWQVPVTITLRNRTRVGFGSAASYARLVRVTVSVADADEHVWHCNENGLGTTFTAFALSGGIIYDIDYIAPLSEFVISGTISLSAESAKLYDQVTLNYSLSLGDIDNPMASAEMAIVQSKTHTLQVGEYCQPIGRNDCLLVVSGSTNAAEVEAWRETFRSIGFGMCVFNVSLYHGISYKFPSFDVCAEMAGRIVVILNSPFYRDDSTDILNSLYYPLDYLEQSEMFEAARRHSVRTYIVNYANSSQPSAHHAAFYEKYVVPMTSFQLEDTVRETEAFEGRTQMTADALKSPVDRDAHLEEKYQYCRIKLFRALRTPCENDFDMRMDALADKLRDTRPDRTYYFAKAYQSAVKGSGAKGLFFKRYECGFIEVRRGLDTTYATMASICLTAPAHAPTMANTFVLLKLLPFSKKLELFVSVDASSSSHYQVSLSIASDIADEQNVFLNFVREKMMVFSAKKEQLISWLTALSALEKYDFSDLCQSEAGSEALKNLLLRLCGMASQYNKAHMIKSNFLARAVLDACFSVMKGYLGITTEEEFKQMVSNFPETQQLAKGDNQVAKLRDPHDCANEVLFNHWIISSNRVVVGSQALNSPSSLELMKPSLDNMRKEGTFKKAVEFFSKAPVYHNQVLPSLYAVPPDVKLLSEGSDRKQCYYAKGDTARIIS